MNDIAEYILTSSGVELKNGVNLLRLVKVQARQVVGNGQLVKTRDNMYRIARGPGRPSVVSASSKTKAVVSGHHHLIRAAALVPPSCYDFQYDCIADRIK